MMNMNNLWINHSRNEVFYLQPFHHVSGCWVDVAILWHNVRNSHVLSFRSLLSTIVSKPGKIYACAFCNADFRSKNELKKHRKIHAGQVKTFDCDRCPSRFTLESEYYSHIKFGHGKVVKPYVCKVCQTSSISEVGLYRHVQKYHSGKPMLPHVCSYCGKGYPNRYCLNQHLLKHTGERPFKCSYCPKTFTLKPLLKQHERFHTGERPYACEVCRKKFVSAALLSMHKKNMHPEYRWALVTLFIVIL